MPTPGLVWVYLVLIVAILAVTLAAIFVRLADAPGVVVAAYRMALASLVLIPISARGLRSTPLTAQTLLFSALAGLFLGAHFATWITSLSYTTVAASTTLVSTTPLWITLFSWLFLRTVPSLSVLLGVLVAVAGGAMIGFGDLRGGNAPLLGDALALSGAIFLTGYFLLGRSAQRHGLRLDAYAGLAYGVAAAVLLPLPAIAGLPYIDYRLDTFLWIALLALIPQLVGHTGINFAMKRLDPTFVATVALLDPVGSTMLAFLFFREVPSSLTLVGALVLLLGIAITARASGFGLRVPPVCDSDADE
ncbi:MAG: DMT family transporter [Truepera sp.]|nr:DMT family transporter [Truepera sp.]